MDKKLLFVFNPHSGKAMIKNRLLDIIQSFVNEGYRVETYPTKGRADATRVINERGAEFDRIVVSGGDGTLNESISGLLNLDKKPCIGYIPTGTTNDFASNLKIPKDMRKAANIAVEGNPFDCDVGKFNDRNFLYVAAFGAFTDVAYETPQVNKNILGQLAYFFEGIKKLYNIKSYKLKLKVNGEEISGDYIFGMASNSNYVAGMKAGSKLHAALNDGLFEILLVKNPANIIEFQALISDLMMQNITTECFTVLKTNKASFEFEDDVAWTLDGEYGGTVKTADISLEEKAVRFITGIK